MNYRKIRLGATVKAPIFVGYEDCNTAVYPGKVIWIHPERRFFVLEFQFRYGKCREAYLMPPSPKKLATTVSRDSTRFKNEIYHGHH